MLGSSRPLQGMVMCRLIERHLVELVGTGLYGVLQPRNSFSLMMEGLLLISRKKLKSLVKLENVLRILKSTLQRNNNSKATRCLLHKADNLDNLLVLEGIPISNSIIKVCMSIQVSTQQKIHQRKTLNHLSSTLCTIIDLLVII